MLTFEIFVKYSNSICNQANDETKATLLSLYFYFSVDSTYIFDDMYYN